MQRVCELLTSPHKHHRTKLKLLAALDKLLSVTSIIPEGIPEAHMANHTIQDAASEGGARQNEQAGPATGSAGDVEMGEEAASGAVGGPKVTGAQLGGEAVLGTAGVGGGASAACGDGGPGMELDRQ